jgi:nitrite reductase (cytochrome c-552)
MDLITDLQEARTAGRTDEQLATVRDLQCEAQFSRDFIATENSMGFHLPRVRAMALCPCGGLALG